MPNEKMKAWSKLIEPPGECRSNHEVICELAKRVGADHPGFTMSDRELIDWTLQNSNWGTIKELEDKGYIDAQPAFDEAHLHDQSTNTSKRKQASKAAHQMEATLSSRVCLMESYLI